MNAFVCSSPIQLIRAIQLHLRTKEFSGASDLYLGHPVLGNSKLIQRLNDSKVFDSVHYINTAEYRRAGLLHLMMLDKKCSFLRKKYQKLISFNIEGEIVQAIYNLNKKYADFEYHCVEDTPGVYNIYIPNKYSAYHPYRLLGLSKQCFDIHTWWSSCPEIISVPKEFTTNVNKLPTIDTTDKELLDCVNNIFDYKDDVDLDDADLLIMEESHFTDGLMQDNYDFNLYSAIAERFNNRKVVIKLHPRTKVNRFIGHIPILKNSSIPWELYIWNRCYQNKKPLLQMSIVCGTMVSDKLMFNDEGSKIILSKLFYGKVSPNNGAYRVSEKITSMFETIQNIYNDKGCFFIPNNEDEMYRRLDYMLRK